MNCPNCGAPLLDPAGKATVVCDHCGSVIALKLPSSPGSTQPPAAQPGQPPAPLPYLPGYRAGQIPPASAGQEAAEPSYEYGQVPQQHIARSELTSVALGPDDAARVIQLLHDHQDNEAVQFYQAKTGSSLDEAADAISAIEAGLRDVSAPLALSGRQNLPDPASMPEVAQLAANGDAIGAIRAYRAATGVGLREAKGRIDAFDEQLRQQAVGASPATVMAPSSSRSGRRAGALGCPIGCLGILALFMCMFGGCSAYVQTKASYQCSLTAIKSAVAKQDIFTPPINAGYLVFVGSFSESGGGGSDFLNMAYDTPVWGAKGWGWVDAHVTAFSSGRTRMSATFHQGLQSRVLLPDQQLNCAQ